MLSSSTDLCLIFIKTAEAEDVTGGAVAPSLPGRSDSGARARVTIGTPARTTTATVPATTTTAIATVTAAWRKLCPYVKPSCSLSSLGRCCCCCRSKAVTPVLHLGDPPHLPPWLLGTFAPPSYGQRRTPAPPPSCAIHPRFLRPSSAGMGARGCAGSGAWGTHGLPFS